MKDDRTPYQQQRDAEFRFGILMTILTAVFILSIFIAVYFGNLWLTERCYARAESIYGMTDPTAKAMHCTRNRWA